MRQFSASPREMFASIWRNRELIGVYAKRDVLGRYRGSIFGLFWSFINPLFMLAVYTFVFSAVFGARWSANSNSKTEFALVLFAGLIVFNFFAECANRAPGLILANTNYVTKIVFPLEILPIVALLSALYHGAISLAVWLGAYVLMYGLPHWTVLYLPVVGVPFILLVAGVTWGLAALGVYLRDIAQFIGVVTTTLMFLSPIFYPATALPEDYRHLLYINPLTPVIEQARDVLYWGRIPDATVTILYWMGSLVVAWCGFALFQKSRKGFADVL